jgi:hypothetical protein
MKKSESIALNTYLSYYNGDDTYKKTLEKIELQHDDVAIWEVFEYHDTSDVINWIETLKRDIEQSFYKRKKRQ